MNPTIPDDARDSVLAVADRLRQIAAMIEAEAANPNPGLPAAYFFAHLSSKQIPGVLRDANAVYRRLGKTADRWVREKASGPGLPLS